MAGYKDFISIILSLILGPSRQSLPHRRFENNFTANNNMKKIALGSDHAGFRLKEHVKHYLVSNNYEVLDFGTDSEDQVDYPDFVFRAAECVSMKAADYGIVFGGSGNGEAIAANKVKDIRCALCWSYEAARLARVHNNANMISFGGRLTSLDEAIKMVDIWLESEFEGGRHLKRIELIAGYESSIHG
jgi:ribose 5-phosphate isomerase B